MQKVLIVEDEPLVALHTAEILAELGFLSAVLAHSLKQAVELTQTMTPCFCVLDVNLGRDQVFPLAQELDARGIPFFFLTGEDQKIFPPELHGHRILTKPIEKEAAERALQALGFLPAPEAPAGS